MPSASNYGKVKFSCISRYIVLVMAVSGGTGGRAEEAWAEDFLLISQTYTNSYIVLCCL